MRDDQALDRLAGLVLEDGRHWGSAATPEQWSDARAVLTGEQPYHFLTRARGYSKTTDLAGIALAAMLTQLPERSSCYALASDRDQGRLLADAAEGLIIRTPALPGAFNVEQWKIAATRSGTTLEILAADAPGAWGLRPALVIADELAQWTETSQPRKLWEAVSSAVAKMDGSRLVVLTTAGAPEHWSHKILEHARAHVLWRVSEIPGPPPWMSPERLEEQWARLPESSFRRLFGNEWITAEDRLTTLDDLRACVTLDGPMPREDGRRYAVGCDIGIKKDRTAVAVCSENGDGRVRLDRLGVWTGSRRNPVRLEDVQSYVREAATSYGARVYCDPWQAVGMIQTLRAQHVGIEEFNFSQQSNGRLAVTLHTLIRDQKIDLPDDEELLDELANVRLIETSPGAYKIEHDSDKHNDRAIAIALAAHQLLSHPQRRWEFV